MKKVFRKDVLEREIENKRYSLANDLLNAQEEKKLIKEIEDLERSLPHTIPLAIAEENMEKAK